MQHASLWGRMSGLLRTRHARGLHPRAPGLRHRKRRDRRRGGSGRGARCRVDALLPIAPLSERRRRRRSEGAARRADVRSFRDALAGARSARSCATTRSMSRTGSTRATSGSRTGRSGSTTTSSISSISSTSSGEQCHVVAVCQPAVAALAAIAVMARERNGDPARESDADGRPHRPARLADQGQCTRPGQADRMVPRQHDRRRAAPGSRGAAAASIRAFSSFPLS